MQRLCISLCVALACLLAFSVGQDDVFRRDQLIVYRIGDSNSPASPSGTTTVPIYLDYYETATGVRKGSYAVRTAEAGSYARCTHSQSAPYTGHLGLSALKTSVGFGCFRTNVGTTSPENSDSKVINRVVSYLGPDGFIDTATPIGGPEGDPGIGKGYITSVLNPKTGTFSEVTALVSFSGNTLKPYYGVRTIDRFFSQNNWKQQGDYAGDNARAIAMSDPDDSSSTAAYSIAGNIWRFIEENTRFSTSLSFVYGLGVIPNDPNGIAAIKYDKTYWYMTDAAAPQRIYKGYYKNGSSQTSYYLNDLGGEYFGITARIVSSTVYIYVTYRPAGESYSELWEFTDAAGEGSFQSPASSRKLATSATGELFKGVAFTPVSTKCRNGVHDDAFDAGVDCGKYCADKCAGGQTCAVNSDCDSDNCGSNVCVASSCSDSILNQGEVDIDCGGPCPKCGPGKQCFKNSDCTSSLCSEGTCTTANCFDGVLNQDETGVDCGGSACANLNNGKCPNGRACTSDSQCVSTYCSLVTNTCEPPGCFDDVKNGNEADVDCGNLITTGCARCADGKTCTEFSDCESFVCKQGICQVATCVDGTDNGFEPPSGDCGQWCVENEDGVPCSQGQRCFTAYDCNNVACVIDQEGELYKGKQVGSCAAASCTDGFHNGFETDIDCGGPSCSRKCPIGKGCTSNTDCEDRYCNGGTCDIPKCDDGTKNGYETDLDCGGAVCSSYNITCALGDSCTVGLDCNYYGQEYCINNVCSVLPSPSAPVTPPVAPPSSAPFTNPPIPDICSTCSGDTPYCDPNVAACVGIRIIPIIQCVEFTDNKYYAFFSYLNTKQTEVTLTSEINFATIPLTGNSNFPMTFQPGRQDIFPQATFVGTSDTDVEVQWYADGIPLYFQLSDETLACPDNVEFQLLSLSDPATLLASYDDLVASLSNLLYVNAEQLNVTITAQQKRAGGAVINVVVYSASASSVFAFVEQGGIEELNSNVPAAAVNGVQSEPLTNEKDGTASPAVNTTPSAPGTTPTSGNTPSGSSEPISKPVSGSEQVAVCGALSIAALALVI